MDARRYLRHDRRDRLKEKTGRRSMSSYGGQASSAAGDQATWDWKSIGDTLSLLWGRALLAVKWLAAGMVLGGLVWSVPVLWGWLDRPIAKVEVSGTFRYLDRSRLQERLKPYLQTTFFGLDVRVIQQVLQVDSWIDSVNVRKVWPDRVEVVLEEEFPVARWRVGDLINANGDILRTRQGHNFDHLPSLSGPSGREQEVMQQYLTLSQQLRPLGLKVAGVDLTRAGSWSFQVDGVEIQLGGDELIERMQRFSRLYFGRLEQEWAQVKSIDLRYRDGIAVAWHEGSASGSGNG